ncbi:hypothetical protein [Microbacterium sp.]|uniref:hypothetical protein n=1 Tax=Microbacterium sp. TaxID=51671 RepID=UPI003918CC78
MTEATQEATPKTDAPGQLVGLIVLTVLSAVAAVVLAVVALFVGTGTYPTDSELAIKVALGWWSNFALTVTVVAFVGTLVLAGIRRMLGTAGFRV